MRPTALSVSSAWRLFTSKPAPTGAAYALFVGASLLANPFHPRAKTIARAVSSMRLENPHSLSYQAITFTSLPFTRV